MQKLFCKSLVKSGEGSSLVSITGADAHHLHTVLRMKPGEQFLVSCGDEWEYTCEIQASTETEVTAQIIDAQKPGKELPSRITLLQCLPKGDKLETVIQKAVELGAAEIVPVASARCVVKLDAKRASAKVERWRSIAKHAAEQARRLQIPTVHPVLSFTEALAYAGQDQAVCLLPYEKAEKMSLTRQVLEQIRPGQPVAILIGPEGGFTEQEVQEATEAGFTPITLGQRILRTETAGMALLAMLVYRLETE